MERAREILFWRRTDVPGLERLELSVSADAVLAVSTVKPQRRLTNRDHVAAPDPGLVANTPGRPPDEVGPRFQVRSLSRCAICVSA
ncbi:MAG TPA: hypothetical protein VD978_08420 [Azospirillum sp.]|nr:hypothetical protein [Azospirillum sp.]